MTPAHLYAIVLLLYCCPVTASFSESLARRYFPNADPIGQKIRVSGLNNTDPYMDMVGVVGDLKFWGLTSEFRPAYYQPYTQNLNTTIFLLVRSSRPSAGIAAMIEREVHSMDKDAVVRRAHHGRPWWTNPWPSRASTLCCLPALERWR